MNPPGDTAQQPSIHRDTLYLYNAYTYAYNLLFGMLELLPQFARRVFFRAMFRKLGAAGLIDYKTYFRYPSKMSIGDHSYINHGCCFYGSSLEGVEIVIGNDVALGPHVKIFTATHDYSTHDLKDTAASVKVEDNAWVGGGSIILPGVTIGRGAVIGAGSVVTKDVPAFSVAVGNPARVVRERVMGTQESVA
jgi:acetyltransferase-like isoleucine patch superfamily enzyme